jgi:cell division transport system permease protein
MAKPVKSLKRGKANYTYSIIGVTIVLFILGFTGWLFLIVVRQGGNALKENNVAINAFITAAASKDSIKALQDYVTARPYSQNVEYTDKEKAKENWLKDGNEDWQKVLPDQNPLPESIDFHLKADYANNDSIEKITADLTTRFPTTVSDIGYRKSAITTLNTWIDRFGLICLVIGIVLCIIVIVSIDNTIRLAMFSNRFLIKTMQMVGATRGFIARPMAKRALLNGFISSLIAIGLLYAFIRWFENIIPELHPVNSTPLTLYLFAGMIIIGMTISLFSTHRSVMKYLRMKLDDLY